DLALDDIAEVLDRLERADHGLLHDVGVDAGGGFTQALVSLFLPAVAVDPVADRAGRDVHRLAVPLLGVAGSLGEDLRGAGGIASRDEHPDVEGDFLLVRFGYEVGHDPSGKMGLKW